MIFVEVFRLLLVIAGTIGGLTVGNDIGRNTTAPVVGITLGALASYLLGGIIGRLIDRGLRGAVGPAPLDAGQLGVRRVGGGDDGPAPRARGRPPGGGPRPLEHRLPPGGRLRLGAVRGGRPHRGGQGPGDRAGRGDVASARPPRRAAAGDGPARGQLGGDGPLPHGARAGPGSSPAASCCRASCVDEVRALSHSPDPVSSRRAHRGLEAIEALQADGVAGVDERGRGPRARRHRRPRPGPGPPPARPPGHVLDRTGRTGRGPGHRRRRPAPPGRRAVARPPPGRAPRHRPRQGGPPAPPGRRIPARGRHGGGERRVASGGAAHDIEVVVSSARQTSQGLLVFAQLFEGGPSLAQQRPTPG